MASILYGKEQGQTWGFNYLHVNRELFQGKLEQEGSLFHFQHFKGVSMGNFIQVYYHVSVENKVTTACYLFQQSVKNIFFNPSQTFSLMDFQKRNLRILKSFMLCIEFHLHFSALVTFKNISLKLNSSFKFTSQITKQK